MVGAPTQALVAQQLGMDNYIISRQQLTQEKMGWKQKILADLMEAFIAALFIGKNKGALGYSSQGSQILFTSGLLIFILPFRSRHCSC